MKNSIYTTINGGKYKGKKLLLPSLKTTRSTKSIIKESFFNTVQFEIIGKNFIEVFAGSGSMGLEALSRGAKKTYFIEKDPEAYKVLLQNIKSLKVQDKSEVINADSFIQFPKVINSIKEKSYFYFDPPFEIRDGMDEIYDKSYKLIESIPTKICELIAVEHRSGVKLPEKIGKYKLKKNKKFGKTTISYFLE